jgi:molybdopterin converting factor small subunit
MRIDVLIPGLLRSYTGGERRVALDLSGAGGESVDAALRALDARYPGIRFRVVDEQGAIRRHIRIFIGRDQARTLSDPLVEGTELMIVGALSGG